MRTLENTKLTQKEHESVLEVARVLKSDLPISRVVLFGSKARGAGDMYSDIDLLVLTSCPVTASLRESISERLAQINLENDVMLSSVAVSEQDWSEGLVHHMLIHREVERDGCEI